jgi:RHS repeat-associated protein
MLSMTYPDGEVLTYHYDSGGLVDSATGVKGTYTYNYLQRMDYDKFGQRALQDTGNGTRTTYSYDAADRRLANMQAKLANGYVFQNLNYQYDDAGNVTSVHNDTQPPSGPEVGMQVGGPSTQTFTYDDLYRLTHAEGSYQSRNPRLDRYRYDVAYDTIHNITRKTQVQEMVSGGNTTVQGKTTYDYNYAYGSSKPHAATTIGLYTLAYDANGNMVSRDQQPKPRRQMIWDEENRLACSHENVQSQTLPQTPASCDDAGGTPNNARYYYDDQGTRVVKDDSQFHLYPNRNFSTRGNAEYKHIYIGDAKLITKVVEPVQRIEDRQYYSHPDHLGSTGFITDDSGGMAEHLNYFPSGETWVSEHPSQPVPQQFTGKELDQQTGLYYFGARYYDPRTQVFQTPDPALESYMDGSPNGGVFHPVNLAVYAYAYNNPIRLVDPTGMSNWDRVWGGVKLVGGVIEAGAGIAAGAATSWTGIGAVAGGAVAVHGFDVAVSGARQLWTGERTSSLTSQGLQAAGVSENTADLIDGGISIVGTMGAGALARAGAATGEQVVNQTLQSTARSGAPAHLAAGKAAEQAHVAAKGMAPNIEGVWRPSLEQMQSAAFKVIVGEGKFTAGGLPTGVKLDGASTLDSSYQLRLMVYRAVTKGEQLVLETQRPLNPTFRAFLERWGVQINQIP